MTVGSQNPFGIRALQRQPSVIVEFDSGDIVLWFGSIGSIPSDWILCDGSSGTPDLRDLFVIGAGDSFAVDDTGGNSAHNHTFTADVHSHALLAGPPNDFATGGAEPTLSLAIAEGTSDSASSLPEFHSLVYIQAV